jgi:hypothetical protein
MTILKKLKHRYRKFKYSLLPNKEHKFFCVGLHKTGTTSIHKFAQKNGFKATHSLDWYASESIINTYNFFSDGGSHFEGQNEFPISALYHKYPNSKFILQTRNTKSWLISKCKHAGWSSNTDIQKDDEKMIQHELWKYKSKLTIAEFLKHKVSYENRVREFFREHDKSRFLEINIVDASTQKEDMEKLCDFLSIDRRNIHDFLAINKSKSNSDLSTEILNFIDDITENIIN